MRVLLADDERTIAVTLGDALRKAGHEVRVAPNGEEALQWLDKERFDCVVSDIRMPKMDGLALLDHVRTRAPETAVLLMTAYASVESAVDAMRKGAYDYIQKPFLNDDVVERLRRLQEFRALKEEVRSLREQLEERAQFGNLIGKSNPMAQVFDTVRSIAPTDANVLVEGESGTGKELVAEAIHYHSPRKAGPLVKMSCSVFPETLLEDELFGHVKGAYTDAKSDKVGRFEKAAGGSIFIDDIDDLKGAAQVKLLRVLQEREFERIGDPSPRKVDVRLIAATKRDLWELVQEGDFREDLYFRLNVVHVSIPPLRKRPDDIPLLVSHFIRKHGRGRPYEVDAEAMMGLQAYAWPGNVRELENSLERAIALAGERTALRKEDLLRPVTSPGTGVTPTGSLAPLKDVVAETEARHIRSVLRHTGGNRTEAAKILGVTTKTLWEKMKKHEIVM